MMMMDKRLLIIYHNDDHLQVARVDHGAAAQHPRSSNTGSNTAKVGHDLDDDDDDDNGDDEDDDDNNDQNEDDDDNL